jgi:hypothetical protein
MDTLPTNQEASMMMRNPGFPEKFVAFFLTIQGGIIL